MKKSSARLPSLQTPSRKSFAFLLASVFLFNASVASSALGQNVPAVGPSHCVWGCGGAASTSGGISGGMNMGGLFGGIAVMLGTAILTEALTTPANSPVKPQPQKAQTTDPHAEATRWALQEQQRILQERHHKLVSSLKDLPARDLIDDPSKLSLLEGPQEQVAAAAGRLFDSTSEPDALWMKNHDAWFSTRGYTAQTISPQPMPTGEQPVNYKEEQLQSLECVGPTPYGGKICPFPNMRVSTARMETIELSSPAKMSPPSEGPSPMQQIVSQFSEGKGRILSAFRRNWSNISPTDAKIPDLMTTNAIDMAQEKTLSGLQGETAELGRGMVKNVMTNMAGHFFSQLNQALIDPDSAIQMGEPETLRRVLRDAAGESLPGPAKGGYLLLTGRPEAAADAVRDYLRDKAEGTFKDTLSEVIGMGKGGESDSLLEKSASIPLHDIGPHPDTIRWDRHKQHWLTRIK